MNIILLSGLKWLCEVISTMISIIAAMDENRVIGRQGKLPWHLPKDMARFRKLTMGKPVVMGRKTFESISGALEGRLNIVLSRDPSFLCGDCVVVGSVEEVINLARDAEELMVIGGENVFKQFLCFTRRMYLTIVHCSFMGDTHFPLFGPESWIEKERQEFLADKNNPYACTFLTLEKVLNLED